MVKPFLKKIPPAPLSTDARAFLKLYGDVLAVAVAIILHRLSHGKKATLGDAAEATAHLTPGMPLWRMKALLSAAAHLGALKGNDLLLRPGAGFVFVPRALSRNAA